MANSKLPMLVKTRGLESGRSSRRRLRGFSSRVRWKLAGRASFMGSRSVRVRLTGVSRDFLHPLGAVQLRGT